MADQLHILSLGSLELLEDGVRLQPLQSRKAEALLVYLACTGQPQARETFTDLFWDDRSQAQSLANLRIVLNRLKKLLAAYLEVSSRTIGLRPGSIWLDKAEFDSRFKICQTQQFQGVDFAVLAPQWERVLALYRGAFLTGFHLGDASGFERWLRDEQIQTERQLTEILRALSAGYLNTGNDQAGISHASRLVQIDPLDESAQRRLMLLLARSGQRGAALAQYEACCQNLIDELGVEPEIETKVLYEKIRVGEIPVFLTTSRSVSIATPASASVPEIPVLPTPFFGRTIELAKIAQALGDPDCHLVTLVGPGGIGKTRLAIEAVRRQVNQYRDGVYFVALAPLSDPNLVPTSIADAVHFSFSHGDSLKNQLLNYLRDKQVLLVLDNFEQLLAVLPTGSVDKS